VPVGGVTDTSNSYSSPNTGDSIELEITIVSISDFTPVESFKLSDTLNLLNASIGVCS
jgi:hypothetical protein